MFEIVGHGIVLVGSILMVIAGFPKNKKTCLILQTLQIFCLSVGNLLLGSFPGSFVNVCSGVRNILSYNEKLNYVAKIFLIIISSLVSILNNNIGLFVIFPLLNFVSFTCLMNTKDDLMFKYLVMSGSVLWLIHDLYIKSYVSVAFGIMCLISNLIGVKKIVKSRSSY